MSLRAEIPPHPLTPSRHCLASCVVFLCTYCVFQRGGAFCNTMTTSYLSIGDVTWCVVPIATTRAAARWHVSIATTSCVHWNDRYVINTMSYQQKGISHVSFWFMFLFLRVGIGREKQTFMAQRMVWHAFTPLLHLPSTTKRCDDWEGEDRRRRQRMLG